MRKLSVPLLSGLVLLSLDLLFWVYVVLRIIFTPELAAEGLLAAYVLHLPATYLLNFFPIAFSARVSFLSQCILIFVLGTLQYFLLGYLLGHIIETIDKIRKK